MPSATLTPARSRADAAPAHRFARRRVDEAAADAGHVLDIEFGTMDAVNQHPVRIENAELHEIADVGAAGFAQVFQESFLQRKRAAGNVRRDAHIELLGELVAAANQLFGRHAGRDPMRIGFDDHGDAHAAVVLAVPSAMYLGPVCQRLVEAQRMAGVAGRLAAQLLGEHLANSKFQLGLDGRPYDLRACRRH